MAPGDTEQVKSIVLQLPEPPSANVYWRHNRGRIHLSTEAKRYRLTVRAAYKKQHGTSKIAFPEGVVALVFDWRRSRKSGDLDNRFKQALDALRGVAYTDDNQIVEIHAYRSDVEPKGTLTLTLSNGTLTPCASS